MKRQLIYSFAIAFAFLLCGCSTQYLSSYHEEVYFADYRTYAAEGFTISPVASGFTYEPIGELKIVCKPGTLKNPSEETDVQQDKFKAKWQIEAENQQATSDLYMPTLTEMTDKIVDQARELGANALLNFNIEVRPTTIPASVNGIGTYIDSAEFVISGFAVKLKE